MVEPLLGPDIAPVQLARHLQAARPPGQRVLGTKIRPTEGHDGPNGVVTVWLRSIPRRGPTAAMKVIPRTHEGGYSDYDPVDDNPRPSSPPRSAKPSATKSARVYLELEPNQASLHDGRLMHASDPNTSELRRSATPCATGPHGRNSTQEKVRGAWHHSTSPAGKTTRDLLVIRTNRMNIWRGYRRRRGSGH